MKRLSLKVAALIAATAAVSFLSSCSDLSLVNENEDVSSSRATETLSASLKGDSGAISYNSTYSMYTIKGSAVTNGWAFGYIDLSAYDNKTVTIDLGAAMQAKNSGSSATLRWQVTDSSYTTIASQSFANGTSSWGWVSGSATVTLGTSSKLYLSTYGTTPSNLTINVSSLSIKVTSSSSSTSTSTSTANAKVDWKSATSLKSVYSKYFDYFGFACEYGVNGDNELSKSEVQKGLAYHANTITMGNEFKPQFLFNWATPNTSGTFTSSKGVTIKVPTNAPDFTRADKTLAICKANGLKMRGHVLVWHSQTPDWFFYENYSTSSGKLVSASVMDAREEWYIKTVLNHVNEWEKTNNNGNHIIWAWDVVNEAVADDASDSSWLRGSTSGSSSSSMWYKVYGNYDFIVDAFRYANKYAPSDVKLCYNDYNCYMSGKTNGIIKLLTAVKNASGDSTLPTRIDVMGMQSHVGTSYPTVSAYETALKKFINFGLDVHVTEFDLANGTSTYSSSSNKALYKQYFTMFINNRKTSGHGVTCVTIWGLNDENSWLQSSNSTTQYPLLFTLSGSTYYTKPEFYGVLEAAQ